MQKLIIYFFLTAILGFISSVSYSFNIKKICRDGSDVTIYWEIPSDTCQAFYYYKVFGRSSVDSSFKEIVQSGKFTDSQVSFQITVGNPVSWDFFMNVYYKCANDTVVEKSEIKKVDKTAPEGLELDSASVNGNNKIILGWAPSKGNDTKGYYIFFVGDNGTQLLDTVYGKFTSKYIDSIHSNAEIETEQYRIVAFDMCGNTSPLSQNPQGNILLKSALDSCKGEINLTWNRYLGWDASAYRILMSVDDNPYTLINEVSGFSTNYLIKNIPAGNNLKIRVRAVKSGSDVISSSSNIIKVDKKSVINPSYIYVRKVSVIDSVINVFWSIDKFSDLRRFIVYRSLGGGNFDSIGNVPYSKQLDFRFLDNNAKPDSLIYTYRIKAINICGNAYQGINTGSNILLKAKNKDNYNVLSWNNYKEWDGGVEKFDILKYEKNSFDEFVWLKIGESGKTSFSDIIGEDSENEIGYCYFISAIENGPNSMGYSDTSYSNIDCDFEPAIVYIPNAFLPGGINSVFQVKGVNIDKENSEMWIYDRWGEEIFHTRDVEQGWDGMNGNEVFPVGQYLYRIIVMGKDRNVQSFSGKLYLIR